MENATDLSLFSEALGHVAYYVALIQPFLKTELHTIFAALFPIVIGAHASLTRPTSAAKPQKMRTSKTYYDGDGDGEEEEEATIRRMEGFSRSDALFLPLFAGATLTGLYMLIKYLENLDFLNMLLNYYFSSMGVFSVCKLLADMLQFSARLIFPEYYTSLSGLWQVSQGGRETLNISAHNKIAMRRSTPLPGLLAYLPLPNAATQTLWQIRHIVEKRLTFKLYISKVIASRIHLSLLGFLGAILGLAATIYYNFVAKTWWLTNLMGFAFSYTALQFITPTTFDTGSLILGALFVYDIYMVFFTPMMVTVAKNLDVPIKLLIPRNSDKDGVAQFSMLGLGDVVLPGMMIALALRFDLYLHYLHLQQRVKTSTINGDEFEEVVKAPYVSSSKHWTNQFWTHSWFCASSALPEGVQIGTFKKTYFWSSVVGYVIGMITTLCVMVTFQHPQPALLYLVPGVLVSLWGMAWLKGDLKVMYEYTEAEEEESSSTDKQSGEKNTPSTSSSFFSREKVERNSNNLDKTLSKYVEHGHTTDEDEENKKKRELKKLEKACDKVKKKIDPVLFHFSISWYQPKSKTNDKVNWKSTEGKNETGDEHGRKRLRTN